MDSMCFEMKRAHWRGVGITNFLFKARQLPITAARFDILHAVVMFSPQKGPVQVTLTRMLGCNKSTVSRMLKALEAMGFVKRVRAEEDRRYKRVTVTKEGMEALQEAAAVTLHDEKVKHRVDLATAEAHLGRWQAEEKRKELSAALTRWRWVMGDWAPKPDPWTYLRAEGGEDPLATARTPRAGTSDPELPALPEAAQVKAPGSD